MQIRFDIRSNLGMIACYGEALVDLFVNPSVQVDLQVGARACLGGSIFNFCLAAQRQGMRGRYLNCLSTDGFGRQFERLLRSEGVLLDAQSCHAPTALGVIDLDLQGRATYAFHRHGVADLAREASAIIADWHPLVRILHTGCLMLTPDAWSQTKVIMEHAAGLGCLISVDANLRLAVPVDRAKYISHVHEACAAAHIVKVSDDDLWAMHSIAEYGGDDDAVVIGLAQQLLAQGGRTHLVALTLGDRGAALITREGVIRHRSNRGLAVVDTVGAGDTFIAALLAHLSKQDMLDVDTARGGWIKADLHSALIHAMCAAEICVERVGCDPPTWQQTVQRVQLNPTIS